MKVLKNLFGNNTKISADNIVVKDSNNKARILDKSVIVDSGGNSNGNWVKWADGTMICWNTINNISVEITQNLEDKGFIYYGYCDAWTEFPVNFIEPPTTSMTLITGSNCFGIQVYEKQYNNRPPGFYPLGVVKKTYKIGISYIAIGKWK